MVASTPGAEPRRSRSSLRVAAAAADDDDDVEDFRLRLLSRRTLQGSTKGEVGGGRRGGGRGLLLPPPSFRDRRTTTTTTPNASPLPPRRRCPSSSLLSSGDGDDFSVVVFGLAWCPPLPRPSSLDDDEGDDVGDGKRRFLAACTNRGDLRFFDVPPGDDDGSPSSESDDDGGGGGAEDDDGGGGEEDRSGKRGGSRKKRPRTDRGALGAGRRNFDGSPALRVEVTEGTLYHVQFHHPSSTASSSPLLLVSGVGGVWAYRWSAFLPHLDDGRSKGRPPRVASVEPIAIHRPYPSPYDATPPTEINAVDVDPTTDRLYGAAGDGFGVYRWDLETQQLVGTFGGGGGGKKRGCGHEDYLHSVKVVRGRGGDGGGGGDGAVLTGGEDGRLGMWDAKSDRPVEFFDIASVLRRPGTGPGTTTKSWIADVDVEPARADWAVLCGGIEGVRPSHKKSSSSIPSGGDVGGGGGGFVSLLHLPTRSVASSAVVRETVQAASYRDDGGAILTLGNESVVSSWGPTDVTTRRGRGWCSCPSGYAIAVEEEEEEGGGGGRAAVGGVGKIVDVFQGDDAGHRSFRLTLS